MEYGITFPRVGVAEHPSPLKYLTNFAQAAEQMGCAYGVVGDRLEGGIDPFSILTAIAEASGRMRLATSVLVLPPRGILVAAKQYASLDVLTGGRVIAGVGTGSLFRDYEVVGMDHSDMWPRFEEGVRAMRAYLTHGAPPFTGRFYNTAGVQLEPTPVQRPSLPIWIGSWGSTAGLRRVARLADGWLSSAGPGHQSPEQFAEDVARLKAFLVQEGKDPTSFPNAVSTMALFISEDPDELARLGGPGYVPRPEGLGVVQPAGRPLEDAHAHDMVGTQAACLDKARRWKAAGAQALFLVPRGSDPLGQMRLFLHEVASRV
jgi:alkanesulfonate monooxygenase SsuD/methylene tetrahydromethanopterin reductase-like flavin-dependent oxidoreductase (luciferase family)